MKSKGFIKAGSDTVKRLIMSIDGLEKNGKNHFAFTAPGPLAVISLDNGLDGVVQKFQREKEIYVAQYRSPIQTGATAQDVSNSAQATWKGIATDYLEALETKEMRSVILDTGTEMWETLRLARFGKLTQVMPHHYGPVNAEWRDVVRQAYDHDKHVLYLHKLKDDYVNDKRTGEYKRSGMSDMGFLVQVAGRCWKDPKVTEVPDKFHFTISDCRFNPELEGLDFAGEECNFPFVASYVLYGDDQHAREFL
jgi:hypothetical protein